MSKRCRGLWALLFLTVSFSLAERALCNFVGEGHLQTDISRLSETEASEILDELENDILQSDRALEALEKDLTQLREEQEAVETEAKTLAAERQKEAQERVNRDGELSKAKEAIQAKEASISMMSVRKTELKGELASLESKLAELERKKEETEKMYADPSMLHVLSLRALQWDSVPRNVFNKTMHEIVPVFSGISQIPTHVKNKISETSPALALLVSLVIQGLCWSMMLMSWEAYKRIRGQVTITRMILLGDVICAIFWSVVIVCYLFLFTDPLHAIQERSAGLFFAFQMLAFIGYFASVFLRTIVLSSKLSLQSLGETLAFLVLGQHYYVRVWKPAIVNHSVRGALFYYMCYVALFGAFAASRISRLLPHKQRGAAWPIRDYVKILRWSNLR